MTIQRILALGSMMLAATPVFAGDAEDRLIDKVVSAYGGDAFLAIKSLQIDSRLRIISTGQSASPDEVNIASGRTILTLDYENGRKSQENLTKNRAGVFLNQVIHDGAIGHAINHIAQTHTENPDMNFDVVGGGTMRTFDTTLVKVMLDARSDTALGDVVSYKNRPHATITVPMAGSPVLTLYIDQNTGLISKMRRMNPQVGALDYVFSDYRSVSGVTYAASNHFLVAGQANSLVVDRTVIVNPDLTGVFDVPQGYRTPEPTIDRSQMTVREVGDGVYHVGQNAGYSVFVDAGDHYVAAGGYAGLTGRFDALKEQTGSDKPLRYQIVTHQHSDHIGGMAEAASLGATFVTVASHKDVVQGQFETPLPDDRFMLVETNTTLAGGAVRVIDIETDHAANYLLVHMPALNMVFSADHFSTPRAAGLPFANNNTASFRAALDDLDLGVRRLIDAHSPRELSFQDLRTVTDGYTEPTCPPERRICQN